MIFLRKKNLVLMQFKKILDLQRLKKCYNFVIYILWLANN